MGGTGTTLPTLGPTSPTLTHSTYSSLRHHHGAYRSVILFAHSLTINTRWFLTVFLGEREEAYGGEANAMSGSEVV